MWRVMRLSAQGSDVQHRSADDKVGGSPEGTRRALIGKVGDNALALPPNLVPHIGTASYTRTLEPIGQLVSSFSAASMLSAETMV